MKRLSGGIDVGSESHHITILDEEDNVLYNQKIAHQLSEFTESIKLFKQIEKQEGGKLSFALEGKNGYSAPLDRILLDQGFTLYNVDNFKLKRFREAFAGEWRDDQRDALMLSKMLKLKDHINSPREKVFIKIEKPSPVTESLKLLSRHQQTLIDEKVRLTNRLRKKLLEVCPIEAIEWVSNDDGTNNNSKKVKINEEICLGCGICVRACSNKSITLEKRKEQIITPVNSVHRIVLMAIEKGKLQELIFDNQAFGSHRAMAAVLAVILKLPPIKQMMASKQMKSIYLEKLL